MRHFQPRVYIRMSHSLPCIICIMSQTSGFVDDVMFLRIDKYTVSQKIRHQTLAHCMLQRHLSNGVE